MDNKESITITVQVSIEAPVEKVWELLTLPEHVVKWSNASDGGLSCLSLRF